MEEVEAALTPQVLEKWKHSLQKRTVQLSLPKFSISASYQLDQILPPLGFTELFSPQSNFSGISEQQNVMMTQDFHKAVLEVDEQGTKAAAATSIRMVLMSAPRHPIISFNRPFNVVIYSNTTDNILFMSKLVNPTIK